MKFGDFCLGFERVNLISLQTVRVVGCKGCHGNGAAASRSTHSICLTGKLRGRERERGGEREREGGREKERGGEKEGGA